MYIYIYIRICIYIYIYVYIYIYIHILREAGARNISIARIVSSVISTFIITSNTSISIISSIIVTYHHYYHYYHHYRYYYQAPGAATGALVCSDLQSEANPNRCFHGYSAWYLVQMCVSFHPGGTGQVMSKCVILESWKCDTRGAPENIMTCTPSSGRKRYAHPTSRHGVGRVQDIVRGVWDSVCVALPDIWHPPPLLRPSCWRGFGEWLDLVIMIMYIYTYKL